MVFSLSFSLSLSLSLLAANCTLVNESRKLSQDPACTNDSEVQSSDSVAIIAAISSVFAAAIVVLTLAVLCVVAVKLKHQYYTATLHKHR